MDLARFISLLEKSSLYFARVGVLAEFDPFEGRFGHWQASQMTDPKRWKISVGNGDAMLTEKQRSNIAKKLARSFMRREEMTAHDQTFVNCWHANESESDAMWRLYSLQGQGLAVCTTFARLRRSLEKETRGLLAGRVKYGDYSRHTIWDPTATNLVFNKRDSFTHEREFRLAYQMAWKDHRKAKALPGIYIPFDAHVAIERILVSPASPTWVVEIVQSLVERYGLKTSLVIQSPLYLPRKRLSRRIKQ